MIKTEIMVFAVFAVLICVFHGILQKPMTIDFWIGYIASHIIIRLILYGIQCFRDKQ